MTTSASAAAASAAADSTILLAAQDAFIDMIKDVFHRHSSSHGGMVIDVEGMPKVVSLISFFEEKGWAHYSLPSQWGKGLLVRWGEGKIVPTPLVLA